MNPFLLYLILKLDDVQTCASIVFVSALVVWAISWAIRGMLMDDGGDSPRLAVAARRSLVAAIASLAVMLVTPSTKQVAAIYVLHKLTESQTLAAIERESGELYGLFKAWLRAEIEETTPTEEVTE